MKLNHTELRSFFYGTLLGDSYIHNGVFYCKQITKDLIDFKAKIIKQYLPDAKVKIMEYEGFTDKKGVNHQKYYQLSASSSEYIKELDKLFYPNGKKIYPTGIIEKLTPLGFALWYADDGTTVLVGKNETTKGARSRRVQFCTDGFTESDTRAIQQDMKNLGYDCKIIDRKREGQFRIEIAPKDGQRLFLELETFFYYFPELLYKMDLGYRTSSLQNRAYVSEEYEALYTRIKTHPLFKDRMIGR